MNQKLINATHTLVKAFHALERAQKELDYKLSCWARDLRAICASEKEFTRWCATELGLPDGKAQELLDRAAVVAVVSDVDNFNDRGGFEKLRPILAFPKREQLAIVQAAKAEIRGIASVIKARHPAAPTAEMPALRPSRKLSDADVLAQWIVDNHRGKLPAEVDVIVRMYVPGFGSKRAA